MSGPLDPLQGLASIPSSSSASSASSPPATPSKSRILARPPPYQRPPVQLPVAQPQQQQQQHLPPASPLSIASTPASSSSAPYFAEPWAAAQSSKSPMAPRPPLPGQAPRPVSPLNGPSFFPQPPAESPFAPASPNAWATSTSPPRSSTQAGGPSTSTSNSTLTPSTADNAASPARLHSPGLPRSPVVESHRPLSGKNGQLAAQQSQQPRVRPPPSLKVRIQGIDRAKKELGIKMDASTNIPTYHRQHSAIFARTYNEFAALHSALSANHPETILPAMPLPQTSAVNTEDEDRYLRNIFQRFMDRICRDNVLVLDDELRAFVEADFGYAPITRAKKLRAGTGFLSRSTKPSPLNDNGEPDFLVSAKIHSAALESALGETSKALEKDIKAGVAAATAYADLKVNLASFATTEAHLPLSNAMKDLAETMQALAELEVGQTNAAALVLGDALAYETVEARGAKEALLQRQYNLDDLTSSIKTTIGKRRGVEKLRGSSAPKSDRVNEALEDLEEAEKHEQALQARVQAISTNLRPALQTHLRTMNEDLLNTFLANARTNLAYETRRLQHVTAINDKLHKIPDRVVAESVYVHPPASHTSAVASTSSPAKASGLGATRVILPDAAEPVQLPQPQPAERAAVSRFAAREAEIKAQMAASQTISPSPSRNALAAPSLPRVTQIPSAMPVPAASQSSSNRSQQPQQGMAQSMYIPSARTVLSSIPAQPERVAYSQNPLGDASTAQVTPAASGYAGPTSGQSPHANLQVNRNAMTQSVMLPGRNANVSGYPGQPHLGRPVTQNPADERKRVDARKAANLLAGAL